MPDEDRRAVQEHSQPPQLNQNVLSQEEMIFSKLNKALSNVFHVIWIIVWPIGLLFVGILGWLGYNTHVRIGQIDGIKQEILDKKNEVVEMASQMQVSRIELNEKQNQIKNEQEKLSKEIQVQMTEVAKLGKNTGDTTRRGNTLIEKVDQARLQAEKLNSQAEQSRIIAEDLLTKNQKTIDEQIKFVESNKNKITAALADVRKKNEDLITEVRTNADKEFEKNKKIISLFVEYQMLVLKNKGIFGVNPDAELKILNQVAETLYPNPKDRNEFINKINQI